eukprot:UN31927
MVFSWLMVHTWNVGYLGLAYAQYVGYIYRLFIELFVLYQNDLLHIYRVIPCSTIFDWKGVYEYLRIAWQMIMQNALSWWVFELTIIVVSLGTHGDVIATATTSNGSNYQLFWL